MIYTTHKFAKAADRLTRRGLPGVYEYRGVRIARDDAERGYWGHWYTVLPFNGSTRERAATRQNLARKIDAHLDKKED